MPPRQQSPAATVRDSAVSVYRLEMEGVSRLAAARVLLLAVALEPSPLEATKEATIPKLPAAIRKQREATAEEAAKLRTEAPATPRAATELPAAKVTKAEAVTETTMNM